MEINLTLSNETIKETLLQCGFPATKENIDGIDYSCLIDMLYSDLFENLSHLIQTYGSEQLVTSDEHKKIIGSFSLDEFIEIATEEYRERLNIQSSVPFNEVLKVNKTEAELDEVGYTFCDFMDTFIVNFMKENHYFSDDMFLESRPDMHWSISDQGLHEFECFIETFFKRNEKYCTFRMCHTFTFKDIENEQAFQTCLRSLENCLKSQIQGCYQNVKPSAF
ncbi:hypothetical protein ABU952_19430 [Bacillus amyloliquefaciens]|uniref:hypothetical protein n=1 Tax=Bacillus amyloliquefaciens TaxID=1390 RepID=UPI00336B61A1